MIFRGDSSTARAPGTHPETPVQMRRPAPSSVALRSHPFVAAGPRRLVMSVLTVTVSVFGLAAALRFTTDGPLRAEIVGTVHDVLTIAPAVPSPLVPLAIGVAILVGVATLLSFRSLR